MVWRGPILLSILKSSVEEDTLTWFGMLGDGVLLFSIALFLLPKFSNMLPNPSDSPISRLGSNFGGVAVLWVLAVMARSLDVASGDGEDSFGVVGGFAALVPKEKVRPPAFREKAG